MLNNNNRSFGYKKNHNFFDIINMTCYSKRNLILGKKSDFSSELHEHANLRK